MLAKPRSDSINPSKLGVATFSHQLSHHRLLLSALTPKPIAKLTGSNTSCQCSAAEVTFGAMMMMMMVQRGQSAGATATAAAAVPAAASTTLATTSTAAVVLADASANADILATAAAPTWRCTLHGQLPLSRFSDDDLRRKRHRCKRCLADKMASYRARFPHRHMWNRFVQHARAEFGREGVDQLSWTEHGQPLLCRLLGSSSSNRCGQSCDTDTKRLSQQYRLAWQAGGELDLQQVHLVKKGSRSR